MACVAGGGGAFPARGGNSVLCRSGSCDCQDTFAQLRRRVRCAAEEFRQLPSLMILFLENGIDLDEMPPPRFPWITCPGTQEYDCSCEAMLSEATRKVQRLESDHETIVEDAGYFVDDDSETFEYQHRLSDSGGLSSDDTVSEGRSGAGGSAPTEEVKMQATTHGSLAEQAASATASNEQPTAETKRLDVGQQHKHPDALLCEAGECKCEEEMRALLQAIVTLAHHQALAVRLIDERSEESGASFSERSE